MNLISILFSYAWIEGLSMLLLIKLCIILLKGISKQKIQHKDGLIELIISIIFFGIPFFSQYFFGIKNIFIYCVSFAVIGMICEFLFDFIWYRLMGSRLYRYFKANLLGFTSWYILPYWAAAGLYFYGSWQCLVILLNLKIKLLDTFNITKDLALIAFISLISFILIIGIKDYLKGKLSKFTGFNWSKYFILVLTIWIPIIYLIIYLKSIYILIYFVFTSLTGIILEGILSKSLKNLYGESFWLYYRYNIFNQGTSLLILPIWGAAALLAFLLFNFFLL